MYYKQKLLHYKISQVHPILTLVLKFHSYRGTTHDILTLTSIWGLGLFNANCEWGIHLQNALKHLVMEEGVKAGLCFASTVSCIQVTRSTKVLKKASEMCYSACGCRGLTHSRHHALNVWTEQKWSFCFCCCHCLVKQQQREQCDASNHIWYASHTILPTWHASREVPGTVKHPQSSLECMCHDGINPQPWLMLYIYNHSS